MRRFQDDEALVRAAAEDAARTVRRPAVVALVTLARKVMYSGPVVDSAEHSDLAEELARSLRRTDGVP